MTTPLVTLTITTLLDAEYSFPDVATKVAEDLLRSDTLHGFVQVTFVNASNACLIIPRQIIKTIAVDGKVRWKCSPA